MWAHARIRGLAVTLCLLAGMAWLSAGGDRLSNPALDPPPEVSAHREAPRDEPAPPTRLQTAPPLPPAQLRRGSYQSVQVNVDASGNNIVGDAANEPSLAVDPLAPHRLVIGWRQFDTIASDFRQAGWGYSHDAGHNWTFAGRIESGTFRSDPVLDFDADGTFYYFSLSEGFICRMFRSLDGGQSWLPGVPAFGGDKQWMAVDRTGGIGHGNIYAAWSSSTSGPYWATTFTRSIDGGATFDGPFSTPASPVYGTLTVAPDGTVYVAGVNQPTFYSETFIFIKSTDAQIPNPGLWPTFDVGVIDMGGALRGGSGPNPVGLLGQVWIASDHSGGPHHGNLYVLCSVDPPGADPMDVHFVRSTDGGTTWSTPVRINDDPAWRNAWQWFGTLSVAPNGRIDVVWNDTRNSNNYRISEVYYASSSNGGLSWTPNVPLTPAFNSHVGWPQQNKLGDYFDMISDEHGADLAYAATFNGEQDVYYVRIGIRDCNSNGNDDEDDINGGDSDDCNLNHVPDECEPGGLLDCNGNGQSDLCDVFTGASPDCNQNGVPDECDIVQGTSPDCNGNAVPDACDVAAGTSADCNRNGVPDECDIAQGASADCNGNGVPDSCDIADQVSADCNGDGVPDECELAAGTAQDCNGNGIPDVCDVTPLPYTAASPQFSPVGAGEVHTYLRLAPPDARGDVTLAFMALGDLSSATAEYYDVALNGAAIGRIFTGTNVQDCVASSDMLPLAAADYNALKAGGDVTITLVPSAGIDEGRCTDMMTYIELTLSYTTQPTSPDQNGDGIPDECQPAACPGDSNCSGTVDWRDIDFFVAAQNDDVSAWTALFGPGGPTCPFANNDVNQDGATNWRDIDGFVALQNTTCP